MLNCFSQKFPYFFLSNISENQHWQLYKEFKENFDPSIVHCWQAGFAISPFYLLHHFWLSYTQKAL